MTLKDVLNKTWYVPFKLDGNIFISIDPEGNLKQEELKNIPQTFITDYMHFESKKDLNDYVTTNFPEIPFDFHIIVFNIDYIKELKSNGIDIPQDLNIELNKIPASE